MNFFSFLRLLYEIYLSKNPNLDYIRRLGLLATKIGQLYALRADFIGVERASILAQLYEKNFDDKNPIHSTYLFDTVFEKKFSSIEKETFAEASIGKVYNAHLPDKTPVVIKVIKSEFREPFLRDVTQLK